MREIMAEASRRVLNGFEVRTEATIITDRYSDPRGESLWELVRSLLDQRPEPPKQFGLFEMMESGVPQ